MSMIGEAGGAPMRAGVTVADLAGAMQLALATVTALLARERHGVGQKVNISAYGAQIWLQSWELNHAGLTGKTLERDGAHHPNVPGMEAIYETKDGGWMAISFAKTEPAWQALCEFGGIPDAATDERWNSVQKRVGMSTDSEIARSIRPVLAAAFRSRRTAEWEAFFDSQPQIIANRVFSHADVLSDPQARANGYITDVELPPIGTIPFVGPSDPLQRDAALGQGSSARTRPARRGDPAGAWLRLGRDHVNHGIVPDGHARTVRGTGPGSALLDPLGEPPDIGLAEVRLAVAEMLESPGSGRGPSRTS